MGSLLIGDEAFIQEARRFRKVMGGGMRQAGYLAAACIYALDHHVERLKEDNDHAKMIGAVLQERPYVQEVRPVQSNIVIFDLPSSIPADTFIHRLNEKNIGASPFGPNTVRFVTHLDVSPAMIETVIQVLKGLTF